MCRRRWSAMKRWRLMRQKRQRTQQSSPLRRFYVYETFLSPSLRYKVFIVRTDETSGAVRIIFISPCAVFSICAKFTSLQLVRASFSAGKWICLRGARSDGKEIYAPACRKPDGRIEFDCVQVSRGTCIRAGSADLIRSAKAARPGDYYNILSGLSAGASFLPRAKSAARRNGDCHFVFSTSARARARRRLLTASDSAAAADARAASSAACGFCPFANRISPRVSQISVRIRTS